MGAGRPKKIGGSGGGRTCARRQDAEVAAKVLDEPSDDIDTLRVLEGLGCGDDEAVPDGDLGGSRRPAAVDHS